MKNNPLLNIFFLISFSFLFLTSCLEEGKNMLINYPGYGVVIKGDGMLLIKTPNGYFFSEEWQRDYNKWENNTPVSFYYDLDFDNQTPSNYYDYKIIIKDCIVLETYFPKQKVENPRSEEVVPLDLFELKSDTIFYPLCFFNATWSKESKFNYDMLYTKDESDKNLFQITVVPKLTEESNPSYDDEFVIDFAEFIRQEGNSSLRDSLRINVRYVSGKDARDSLQYKNLEKTLLLWKTQPK